MFVYLFFFKISYLNYVIRVLFSVKFIWRINEPQKSWHVSLYLLFETDYEDDFDIRPATKKTVEGKELLQETILLVLAVNTSFLCYTKRLQVSPMKEFIREAFPTYWK